MRRAIAVLMAGSLLIAATEEKPAVARISVIEGGTVIVQRAESKKQVTAAVNAPLFPGDFITTGTDARAEVQFNGFTMLRLDANVQARIVANDERSRRVQLAEGTVELSVLHDDDASTAIDTPSVTIRENEPGDVRVTVAADGTTSATARTGSATIETPQRATSMESGVTYVASGDAAHPSISKIDEIGYDAFDEFNAQRDKTLLAALNDGANLPSNLAGYDNLNDYGRWVNVQPYGAVWVPSGVAADWAPYRDGQWTWSQAYGWTWVSNEPWGWVPYHYGNWTYEAGYGWCWVPPAGSDAPDWAPAMVGFLGWGGTGSGTDSYAFVGWVPLAPNELLNQWNVLPPPPAPPPPPRQPVKGPSPRKPPAPGRHTATERNAEFGASGVDVQSFNAGDFAHVRTVDVTRIVNPSSMLETLPLAPTAENAAFTRMPVAAPVALSPVFSRPRFADPIARVTLPSFWNRSVPAQGAPSTQAHGSPARPAPVHSAPSHASHESSPRPPRE